MPGKMPLIAMVILCIKMVDMKPKHYLIEVAGLALLIAKLRPQLS